MELRVLGDVELRVLGDVEVVAPDGPLPLGGARQRRLLATLLVNAGRAVPLSALVDAIWDENPPATAKRQVQNLLSGLRRLLAGHPAARGLTIVARPDGYRFVLGGATLDAQVFAERVREAEAFAGAGHIVVAVAELDAALALWRGPALAGMSGRVLQAAAARLEELRRTATELRFELLLRLGGHAEVIGELTELVTTYPLREKPAELLMLALYRAGRQGDALAAYRRLRAALTEELGIEPGPAAQRLHHAILANDVALDDSEPEPAAPPAARTSAPRAARVPAQLPADIAGFTGRAEQLKDLDQLLAGDPGGTAVMMAVISGMAGIGKTALAVHWGQQVRHLFPDGQLYVNLRGFDPRASAAEPYEVLGGFLDAFDVPPQRIPLDAEARAAHYRSLLADRRVLVVLDNAREAGQVRPLLPGSAGCLVVITSRDPLAGLVAAEGARPVTLDLYEPAEAVQLLAARLGQDRLAAEPVAVDDIVHECARLPLALAVVAARAAGNPRFPLATIAAELRTARGSLAAFGGGDPSTDIRAVFSWSYQRLDESARRLFRLLAALPGPELTVPAAASLAAVGAGQARSALGELARARLVIEHGPGRYGLHDLLRAYANELTEAFDDQADRRAALHRVLDHYLRTGIAADRLVDPHRDPITGLPAQPGVTAGQIGDHDEAMEWFSTELTGLFAAVERAAEEGFDAYAWRLAWTMAYFLERRGHWRPWARAQRTALAAARRLGDVAGQAQAHRSLGRAHVHLGRVGDAVEHLGRALRLFAEAGDAAGQARVHFDLCWIEARQGEHARELEHAERALDLFSGIDHRSGQARALNNVAWSHNALGDHRRALRAAWRALELNQDIDDRWGEADTWDTLGISHHALGQYEQGVACFLRAVRLYQDLGHRWGEADSLARLGEAYAAAGDTATAYTTWRRAVAILDELGHPDADLVRAKLTG